MKMKMVKRTATAFMLIMSMVICIMILPTDVRVRADIGEENPDIPDFKLKLINKGTGVKIIIDKTKRADGYYIHMYETSTPYTEYRYDDHLSICLGQIEKNGKKKRTFTIKGLPEGVYTFRIKAYRNNENGYEGSNCSEEKTIEVKAAQEVPRVEKKYDFSNVKVGDVISFGAYEQDDDMTNGKEEIEWIVLSKSDSKMLVMSKYVLDVVSYNSKRGELVTWESCTLRKWLNEYFYNSAFTDNEKKMIKTSKIKTPANPYASKSSASNDTKDKVFALSLQDLSKAKYGFDTDLNKEDKLRQCSPTEYAKTKGISMLEIEDSENELLKDNISSTWWTRTMGSIPCYAAVTYINGKVLYLGHNEYVDGVMTWIWAFDANAHASMVGVRPAIYISY